MEKEAICISAKTNASAYPLFSPFIITRFQNIKEIRPNNLNFPCFVISRKLSCQSAGDKYTI
jgi:hypothetical protein